MSYRSDGGDTQTQRYYPWGTIRPGPDNALPTDYTFTGQKLDASTGLMYYRARYYDPVLGRFVQADTIVPEPGNPQALNRFSYVYNNPLRYSDPTGHWTFERTPDDYKFLPPTEDLPAIRLSSVEAMVAFEIWPFPVEVSSEAQSPQPQLGYSDPTVWDAPKYLNEGVPGIRQPDAIGLRVEASWSPPSPLKIVGGDINVEVIANANTPEVGVFTTPGLQGSAPSMLPQGSAGLILVYDLPNNSQYPGCCALTLGANISYAEFDVTQPLDPTASGPTVYYIGVGSPGANPYVVVGGTLQIWNWRSVR